MSSFNSPKNRHRIDRNLVRPSSILRRPSPTPSRTTPRLRSWPDPPNGCPLNRPADHRFTIRPIMKCSTRKTLPSRHGRWRRKPKPRKQQQQPMKPTVEDPVPTEERPSSPSACPSAVLCPVSSCSSAFIHSIHTRFIATRIQHFGASFFFSFVFFSFFIRFLFEKSKLFIDH